MSFRGRLSATKIYGGVWNKSDEAADVLDIYPPSFRDGPKDQTRNLEFPGSTLRIAPE
jgi:hypothetical protein